MPDNPEDYDQQLAGMREMINTTMPPEEKVATVKALATTLEMMAWFYREMPKLLKERNFALMMDNHSEQRFDELADILMRPQLHTLEESLHAFDPDEVAAAQVNAKAMIDILMAPQFDTMQKNIPDLRKELGLDND